MTTKKRKIGARIYPAHKPKQGVRSILWWDRYENKWERMLTAELDSGDIWRYCLSVPSDWLLERAKDRYGNNS